MMKDTELSDILFPFIFTFLFGFLIGITTMVNSGKFNGYQQCLSDFNITQKVK